MKVSLTHSEEVISFQHKSQLFSDLTKLFQTVIDYREELHKKGKVTIVPVVKFFVSAIEKEMTASIHKHTGLDVAKVTYFKYPVANFGCELDLINMRTTIETLVRYTGQEGYPSYVLKMLNGKPASYEDMIKISEAIDKDTGKFYLPPNILGKKDSIKLKLFIDLYTMFLAPETLHASLEHLTAEECSAVILHEIGHEMTLLEHAADCYYIFQTWKETETKFMKSASLKDKVAYLKYKAKKVLDDPSNEDVQNNKLLIKVLKGIQKLPDDNAAISKVKSELIVLSLTIGIIAIIMIQALAELYTMPIIMIFQLFDIRNLGWNVKYSDLATNAKMFSTMERYADEYVSRHGGGSHIASALTKLEAASRHLPMTGGVKSTEAFRNSYTYAKLMKFVSKMHLMTHPENEYHSIRETRLNRVIRLRQNTVHALKDANLPDEIVEHYVKEFDDLTEEIKKSKNELGLAGKAVRSVFEILSALTDGATIIDILFDGGFRKKYAHLVEVVEELQSSTLYIQAAKLNQLSKE